MREMKLVLELCDFLVVIILCSFKSVSNQIKVCNQEPNICNPLLLISSSSLVHIMCLVNKSTFTKKKLQTDGNVIVVVVVLKHI